MMRQSVLENAKEEVRIPKNALELAHTQHGIQKRGGGVGGTRGEWTGGTAAPCCKAILNNLHLPINSYPGKLPHPSLAPTRLSPKNDWPHEFVINFHKSFPFEDKLQTKGSSISLLSLCVCVCVSVFARIWICVWIGSLWVQFLGLLLWGNPTHFFLRLPQCLNIWAHTSLWGAGYMLLLPCSSLPALPFSSSVFFFFFLITIPLNQFHLRLWPLLFHLVASCLARQWCVCVA